MSIKKEDMRDMYHLDMRQYDAPLREDSEKGFCENILIFLSYLLVALFLPFIPCFCWYWVYHFQRVVIFRLGRLRYEEAKGPGLVFYLPCVDNVYVLDLRVSIMNIAAQEVLTKDSVTILIDGCVFYYIFDPIKAIVEVEDYESSTGLLAATILRNTVGMMNLKNVLTDRKKISETIQILLDQGTDPWGIKVFKVELQEIMLPLKMQRAMATEAEAEREAKAKVISADGELNASRKLKDASDIISKGSMSLQLRYFQTLATLTSEKHSLIVFPVPVDILPNQ